LDYYHCLGTSEDKQLRLLYFDTSMVGLSLKYFLLCLSTGANISNETFEKQGGEKETVFLG